MTVIHSSEVVFGETRFVTFYKGDDPVIGLEIKPGGVIVVGEYAEDGRWRTIHTAIPRDSEQQADYRQHILSYRTDED